MSHSKPHWRECSLCGKSFTQNGGLQEHKKVHTWEKSNKCNQCDFASSQAGNLRRHSVEKAYKCNQCENVTNVNPNQTKNHQIKTNNFFFFFKYLWLFSKNWTNPLLLQVSGAKVSNRWCSQMQNVEMSEIQLKNWRNPLHLVIRNEVANGWRP